MQGINRTLVVPPITAHEYARSEVADLKVKTIAAARAIKSTARHLVTEALGQVQNAPDVNVEALAEAIICVAWAKRRTESYGGADHATDVWTVWTVSAVFWLSPFTHNTIHSLANQLVPVLNTYSALERELGRLA